MKRFALIVALLLALPSASAATTELFSLGHCATDEVGSAVCYSDGGCTDGTPYCDDDTDCSDSTYDTCAGVSSDDFYTDGNVTADYNTLAFNGCQTATQQLLIRKGAGGFQTNSSGVICFDTSSLADDIVINAAYLFVYVDQVDDADGRNLNGEYYTYDGTCSANEWSKTVTNSAFEWDLTNLVVSNVNGFFLTAPNTSINKTGDTCFRLGISGTATTGNNRVDIAAYNSVTQFGPVLQLDTDVPTATPTRTPTVTNTSINTATPTVTRTATIINTPTITRTPTVTPTRTPSTTPSETHSPMATNSPTQTWTPGGATFTPTPTFSDGCASQTLNEMPVRGSAFLTDTQNFLCAEDVERYALQFFPFTVMGGQASNSGGGMLTLDPFIGFVDGAYVTEDTDIDLSAEGTTDCWIVAGRYTFGNEGVFTRVAGTHWLKFCGGSKPLPLPVRLMWVAEVNVVGGNINTIIDLRGWSPVLRTVETETELNDLLDIHKGQFGQTLDTGGIYVFFEDATASTAEWQLIGIEGNAVLLGGNQTVSGIKTFNEFPVKGGSLTPTAGSQFATKDYVDTSFGVEGSVAYDPPLLEAGQVNVAYVTANGVTTASICMASHTGLTGLNAYSLSAYPTAANIVAVVFQNLNGSTSDLSAGTIHVRCFG